ncbi:MAG: nucleoside-diphosphate kinase [Treponemataceae bacterium]
MERCFVMLKPGVLNRRIVGEIITRLERRGLNMIGIKILCVDKELAQTHYGEHKGKSFYDLLINYTVSGPVIAMVWEGYEAIMHLRKTAGATNIAESLPGTIRGDFALHTPVNIIHASDSVENAEREIALFFSKNELFSWSDDNSKWF